MRFREWCIVGLIVLFAAGCSDQERLISMQKQLNKNQEQIQSLYADLGYKESRLAALQGQVMGIGYRVEAIDVEKQLDTLKFSIHDLEYDVVEKRLVPHLQVSGRVLVESCPCPKKIAVKFEMRVLNSEENVVLMETVNVVTEGGVGTIDVESVLHRHGLASKDLKLRWTLFAWHPVYSAEFIGVKLK